MKRPIAGLSVLLLVMLLLPQRPAEARNHPIRTFTFEERGAEVARLYRLGLENDPRNVAAFCEVLKSDDVRVRKAAIAQIVFTHDESALGPVIEAMGDESAWVRRGAIAVLEKLGDPKAIPALEGALTYVPGDVRGEGDPNLNPILRQEEYFNRLAAALALERLGSDAGASTVREILKGPHEKPVLQMAVKCVILMDLKEATPELLRIARECRAFGEDSPGFFAIRALRIMGDPAYAKQMVQLAKDKFDSPGGFIRMEALNLLPELREKVLYGTMARLLGLEPDEPRGT